MIRGLLETSGTSLSIYSLSVSWCDLRGAARLLLWAPRAVWGFRTELASRETQQTPPCFQEIFLFFFLFVNINYKQNRLKMEKLGPICHHEKSACCLIPSTESANQRRDPSISLATVAGDQSSSDAEILLWRWGRGLQRRSVWALSWRAVFSEVTWVSWLSDNSSSCISPVRSVWAAQNCCPALAAPESSVILSHTKAAWQHWPTSLTDHSQGQDDRNAMTWKEEKNPINALKNTVHDKILPRILRRQCSLDRYVVTWRDDWKYQEVLQVSLRFSRWSVLKLTTKYLPLLPLLTGTGVPTSNKNAASFLLSTISDQLLRCRSCRMARFHQVPWDWPWAGQLPYGLSHHMGLATMWALRSWLSLNSIPFSFLSHSPSSLLSYLTSGHFSAYQIPPNSMSIK